MVIHLLSFLLLAIVILVILIDFAPVLLDWIKRIHIGRYTNEKIWSKSITNVALKWLNNTPLIRVTDNTRFILLDKLKGNYTKKAIQSWQEAALLLGLGEYSKITTTKQARKEIIKFLNKKFDKNGQWIHKPIHVDEAIIAYAVMKLDFIDIHQYKKAYDSIWHLIKEHIGEDSTVGYRKSMQSYRYVDTIGFICPFLVAYGKNYNKPECIDLAVKQIKEFENYGLLDKEFIPCHAYKVDNKVPLGLYGWGRGIAWFALGLIDMWQEIPYDNKNKRDLEKTIVNLAKSIINLQQENGSWNWTITRDEARSDSSTTAILAWFLLQASNIKDIKGPCIYSKNKAISYLMSVTRRNGEVDFSQGDTKDIGVYSMRFNILPFTQGFCIRTICLSYQKEGITFAEEVS